MNFNALIENLGLTLVSGAGQTRLSDLTDDTRRVTSGCLFVARGAAGQDENESRWRGFVADAIARGAAAIVAPAAVEVPKGVSLVVPSVGQPKSIDQRLAGQLAARVFGDPAKRLKLIGITGTNGKTTVATLTQYLLSAAGMKCGLLGTVAIDHGSPDGPTVAELTTPGAIDLHRHFAAMVANGCEACAMEVSSHALDQGRVDGLEFDVAVFTNLTQDHLDYHGTMENYAAAKAKLFASLSPQATAVINVDASQDYEHVMSEATHAKIRWTTLDLATERNYQGVGSTDRCLPIELTAFGSEARFDGLWGTVEVTLPIVGRFNLSNLLQAMSAAHVLRPLGDELVPTIQKLPLVAGRLEPVTVSGIDTPSVIVDYAHTSDALENVAATLRAVTEGKLIVVFGCGGDRDRAKRPLMAQAACGLADVAVLTSDNPRTEDPQQILDDAIAGVPPEAKHKLMVEIDRAEAIESAILNAGLSDTVLIAGKGHEDYQILGAEKIHFDDREHAAAALAKWADRNGGGKA